MKSQRWQDWAMLIFGVWVFLSPLWMPAYASRSDAAAWSSYVLGILVGADAIWMLSAYRPTERAGA